MFAPRSNRKPIVYVNDRTVFTVDIGTAVARIIYPISGTVQIFCLLWVHYASLHSNSPGAERSTFEISDPGGNSRSTCLINGARVFLFSIRSRWSPGLLKNSWLLPSYFILMHTPSLGLGYASYLESIRTSPGIFRPSTYLSPARRNVAHRKNERLLNVEYICLTRAIAFRINSLYASIGHKWAFRHKWVVEFDECN